MKIFRLVSNAAGLAYGAFVFLFAAGLAGAGHGWGVPLMFGATSVITTPILLDTFFKAPDHRVRRLRHLLVFHAVADVLFCLATASEGLYYAKKMGWASLVWVMLFTLPQLIALIAWLRDRQRNIS